MKNSPGTGLSNDDGDGNKNVNKVIGLGPVHTNTFSFENAYISKRWCLPGDTYTPSVLSRKKHRLETKQTRLWTIEGLSNDDDDGNDNENGKKAILIGLDWQKTTFHVHHAFLYISLPSLQDCDVKMRPKITFCGKREHTRNDFVFLFVNFNKVF